MASYSATTLSHPARTGRQPDIGVFMQFVKKHQAMLLAIALAACMVFFGLRLFGESAKFGDALIFTIAAAAMAAIPILTKCDEILESLASKSDAPPLAGEPMASCRNRQDLEHSLVHSLAAALLNMGHNGKAIGQFIRATADSLLGKSSPVSLAYTYSLTEDAQSPAAVADQVAEAEIVAAGLTAPRVTAEQIQVLMDKLTWRYDQPAGTTSTFANAFLGRFYLATGHSACVSPENFSAELGMKYAREQAEGKARDKLWELEGYTLAKQLGSV